MSYQNIQTITSYDVDGLPLADMFDLDFSNDVIADQSESNLTFTGSSKIVFDDTLKKNVASFTIDKGDEYFSDEIADFGKISNSSTLEVVFKYAAPFGTDYGIEDIKMMQPIGNLSRFAPNPAVMSIIIQDNSQSDNGKLRLNIGINDGVGNVYSTLLTSTNDGSIKIGQWYHVVATYEGNTCKLYVNGVLANEKTKNNVINMEKPNPTNFAIGSYSHDTGIYQFGGEIAVARLYSTALPAEDIAKLSVKELTPAVVKTTLIDTVASTDELTESDYTADSWAILDDALTKANSVIEDDTATQADVDNALEALIDAINSLTVDKTELIDTVASTDELIESDYTSDSWAVLNDALTKANSVIEDDTATQTDVDDALKALADAIDSLVVVEEDKASSSGTPLDIQNTGSSTNNDDDNVTETTTINTNEDITDTTDELVTIEDDITPLGTAIILTDVDNHWAGDYINKAIELGIANGYDDGTFKPNNNITRAEFVTFMVRAFKITKNGNDSFTDLNNHWAKEYIEVAASNGYVNGYDNNTFNPDKSITREEATVIIARVKALISNASELTFEDSVDISKWAKDSVKSAVEAGIITGNTNNMFLPKENLTRAEAVAIIIRALSNVE